MAEYLLPGWLLTLRREHADLDIATIVANSHDVFEDVRAGSVDVGFVESPRVPDDLRSCVVGVDRLAIVVAASYPLAARADKSVPLHEASEWSWLLREEGSGTRDTFLEALERALGRPALLPHATALGSTATILATARAGGGVAVVSARAVAAALAAGELVELRLSGVDLERSLHAVWIGERPGEIARELVSIAGASGS